MCVWNLWKLTDFEMQEQGKQQEQIVLSREVIKLFSSILKFFFFMWI